MSGSTIGKLFQITTWGESHGKGIGVVVDGCPAGLLLSEEMIQKYLNRRKPGATQYTTPRKEDDVVEILSGVFDGKTTGTAISMIVRNESQRSHDYSEIASYYRPGHADFTYDQKYGFRDYRGGGRSSGRETIGRVAGGAIAIELLKQMGIEIFAYTKAIGPIQIDYARCNPANVHTNPLYMPDEQAAQAAEAYLNELMQQQDSAGGIVECIISGMPAGIGEPVFDKLDANLAKAIMSIGAVKGFEIGSGFDATSKTGATNNDSFRSLDHKTYVKQSNNSGGILGGLSDGSEIVFRTAFKPTPSIFKTQQTISTAGDNIDVNIKGRHDPIIVPRAVVVVEAMAAITILDLLLANMSAKLDKIKEFYHK